MSFYLPPCGPRLIRSFKYPLTQFGARCIWNLSSPARKVRRGLYQLLEVASSNSAGLSLEISYLL